MGLLSEEQFRQVFGKATKIAYGSIAMTQSAVVMTAALAAETNGYTGGVLLTNSDSSITIWIGKTSGITAATLAGNFPLVAGATIFLPASIETIYALAASGAPVLGVIGVVL